MIRVVLEIDNKISHSCSPLDYLKKYILKNIQYELFEEQENSMVCDNYNAKILIKHIEQI